MSDDNNRPQSMVQGATQVVNHAVLAMQSAPLALALLVVNALFLGLTAWILSAVATNAAARNEQQMEMITKLVNDVRDCSGPRRSSTIPDSILRLAPTRIGE